MDKNRSYLTIFKEISASNSFDRLEDYRDPTCWSELSNEERLMLAMLFLKHAEQIIYHKDAKAFLLFEAAEKVAGNEAEVFFYQSSILYAYATLSHQNQYLTLAKEKIEHALKLNSSELKFWQLSGAILSQLGKNNADHAYFEEADEKFRLACSLLAPEGSQRASLYWEWGKSHYLLGKISGEAVDYKTSLEKFQEAARAGASAVAFWNDYGVVLLQIAPLINSAEALLKAIEFFVIAVKEDPDSAVGWYHLGCSFQQLYGVLGQEELFFKANDYFRLASKLNPENLEMWYQWGVLLLIFGRFQRSENHLEEAVEKFSIICSAKPEHVLAQCGLVEALMLLGSSKENLDYLKQAKEKILDVLGKFSNRSDVWCCYGRCLSEFGRYFSNEEYYLEAIAKFQQGLALDNSHPFLWQGLSEAYLALGDLQSDAVMVEKAAYYCSRAIKFKNSLPHFWYEWGIALLKLGEMTSQPQFIEDAVEKFERAIRLRGGIEGNPDLEWIYHLGCALDSLGDYKSDGLYYKKAISYLSYILEKDPEYSQARYNLAVALSNFGEQTYEIEYFRLAIDHFRILNQDDPEDEVVLNDWGLTLLNLGYLVHDLSQAEDHLQILEEAEDKLLSAVALGSVQAFYNLACYYSLTGQFDASMHFLHRAETHHALPSVDTLLHDEWLEGLRETASFRYFISQLKN